MIERLVQKIAERCAERTGEDKRGPEQKGAVHAGEEVGASDERQRCGKDERGADIAEAMRLAFPQSRTIAANYEVKLAPYPDAGSCVLVWNARNAGDAVPSAITHYVQQIGAGAVRDEPHYVEALLNRSSDRMDRFGYLILSDADANCRR